MKFNNTPITFGEVREKKGKPLGEGAGVARSLLDAVQPGDRTLADVAVRVAGEKNKYFTASIIRDEDVAPTITSGGTLYRLADKSILTDRDIVNVQSFPQDYDFCGNNVQYVCGMSVPPNMMANIALEVWNQWLKSK